MDHNRINRIALKELLSLFEMRGTGVGGGKDTHAQHVATTTTSCFMYTRKPKVSLLTRLRR